MAISCSDGRQWFIQNLWWDPEGMQFLELYSKFPLHFFWVKVHFDAVCIGFENKHRINVSNAFVNQGQSDSFVSLKALKDVNVKTLSLWCFDARLSNFDALTG